MTSTAELRRLEAESTPGPWSVDRHFVVGPRLDTDDQSHGMINGVADIYGPNRSKDAALIVAMRNALPELLRKVEALDQVIAECNSTIERYERNGPSFTSPQGDEYEPTSYVIEKLTELRNALSPHGGVDVG